MDEQIRLNELHAFLDELEYPITKAVLGERVAGVDLEYADGEEPFVDVIDRLPSDEFENEGQLEAEIFANVSLEAVGEPGQSEGDA